MPGLSLVCRTDGVDIERHLHALGQPSHSEGYETSVLLSSEHFIVSFTKYPDYPITVIPHELYIILVEGHIYGSTQENLADEIRRVASLVYEGQSDREVTRWLLDTPGEFLIVVGDKALRRVVLLNDAVGHLPIYCYSDTRTVVASRELAVAASFAERRGFDKLALMEYLLFSYPLHERTLFADVHRLEAATALSLNTQTAAVSSRTYYSFNLDQREHADRSLHDNAVRLSDLLIRDCKAAGTRLSGSTHVLSLSGGLDSRVVLAAMDRSGIPFEIVTRRDSRSTLDGDVAAAEAACQVLNRSWAVVQPARPQFEDASSLLALRSGGNLLAMSFMLPYLRELRRRYQTSPVYWTGDTGLVLRRHAPRFGLRSEMALVEWVLRNHAVLSVEDVGALLRLEVDTIRQRLSSVLRDFPEKAFDHRYVHFVIAGRIMAWHYEGMDRNRNFFWTYAPLESTPFFRYAMNCPEEHKTNYRLYREILNYLCPHLATVRSAPLGWAPASSRFVLETSMRAWSHEIPLPMSRLLKSLRRRKGSQPRAEIEECLRRQIASPAVQEYFAVEEVGRFLQRCDDYSAKLLLTVTSVIELYSGARSSLLDYENTPFA